MENGLSKATKIINDSECSRMRAFSKSLWDLEILIDGTLKITVGNYFTLIHICQNILTKHSQPITLKTLMQSPP